jgi:hypothetical protein
MKSDTTMSEITEQAAALHAAIMRLHAHASTEHADRAHRVEARMVFAPDRCWTRVDYRRAVKGYALLRSRQCRAPVIGAVEGRCYCAEHLPAAQAAASQRAADRKLLKQHGIDPDAVVRHRMGAET